MWAQSPGKPTISTVSKSPRGSFFIPFGDFQNPSHHQRILDWAAVVPDSSSNLREPPRAIERSSRAVGLPHLEKSRPHSTSAKLDQNRIDHLAGQTLTAKDGVDRDIQNLGVFPDRERDCVTGNRGIGREDRNEKDSWFTERQTAERFLGPRIGKTRSLDSHNLAQVALDSGPEERGHPTSGRPWVASHRT